MISECADDSHKERRLNWMLDDEEENVEDKTAENEPNVEGRIRIKNKLSFNKCVMSCQGIKSENIVAVGLLDGRILLYNITDGLLITTLIDSDLNKYSAVMAIYFLSEDSASPLHHIMIAIYNSGHIKFWDYLAHVCLQTIKEEQELMDCAINPENTKFATAGTIPKLGIYDIETKQKINTLEASFDLRKVDGHRSKVFTVKYHPSVNNVLLSAGWDNTVRFWDDRQKNSIRSIFGPSVCGKGLDIFEGQILTASWKPRNNLEVWSFDSGKKIREVYSDLHHTYYFCSQWINNHFIVAGGSEENLMCLVDCYSWLISGSLFNLVDPVYCLHAFQYPMIIFVGSGQKLYMIDSLYKERRN
ncbi:WD repeat-containing protein 5B-like [Centruroides sculpturatus]|uniref:WD repeat-containing protein 5B-like n=1 Tax=Centruroides sculpturatus TaxID=218467 RepID=UPI000C6CE3C5|nr:WD repeat-containing protein 5B-like [Centruroides sculpturatus]